MGRVPVEFTIVRNEKNLRYEVKLKSNNNHYNYYNNY